MNTPPVFQLAESTTWVGSYSWRLEDGELRYRGSDGFCDPSITRIPVIDEQLAEFFAALDLLGVWDWKPRYSSLDIDRVVEDGNSWSIKVRVAGRRCDTLGHEGYPGFTNPTQTVTAPNLGRFGLLVNAFQSIFGAPIPKH